MSENITFLFICNFSRNLRTRLAKVSTLSSEGLSPPRNTLHAPKKNNGGIEKTCKMGLKRAYFWPSEQNVGELISKTRSQIRSTYRLKGVSNIPSFGKKILGTNTGAVGRKTSVFGFWWTHNSGYLPFWCPPS